MEENSVVFSVDSGECSEDEEDDLQRKEELRQLLSEQLHDDLLDDSVATSVDGEISLVSSLRYSLSPSERADVITPDMRPTVSPSTNHLSASPSHESHVTSPTDTGTPCGTPPPPSPQAPTNLPPPGGEYHHDSHAHALEQPSIAPSDHTHQADLPTHDVHVVTSNRQLFTQYQSEPQPRPDARLQYVRESPVDRDFALYDTPAPDGISVQPHPPLERSDVFAGTSQAYGALTNHGVGEYLSQRHNVPSHDLHVALELSDDHEYQVGDARMEVLSPSLQQMGLRQLGVLFKARGRHIAELTQQISAQAEDNERHIGILRHEKLLLEKERDQLNLHTSELESIQQSLEKQVSTYQGQLTAEQTRSKALETSKKELLTRLQADEALIKSLTDQVNELTSSETLSRVRESYSSAMAQSNHQHQQEVVQLQEQLEQLREEMERKDETITQIHQELCDLQSHYQAQLATRDQQLAQKDHELQRIKTASHERPSERLDGATGEGPGVAQQLDFGAGGCGFGGEERLKELAAQVEDLTYQLSTTEEELQAALERAGHAEAVSSEQALHLSELEGEREQLSQDLDAIRAELEAFKSQVATEKKEALEQCRAACLKLHEDSTRRLRESVEAEREKSSQQYERQLAQQKSDLATVQEQYVALSSEKEKLSSKLDEMEVEKKSSIQAALDKARLEWLQQQETLVKEAVGVAREEWQEVVEHENKKKVELAIKEHQSIWEKRLASERAEALASAKAQYTSELAEATRRLESEHGRQLEVARREGQQTHVESSREEWEREKERAVQEAVKEARVKWLEEKERSLQCRVESVLSTTEKLWKEQHLSELAKLQQQLQSQQRDSGERVEAVVNEARERWEREHEGKIEEAVGLAKQKFAGELVMRVELAVTNERGKWEEHHKKAWRQQQDSLLATAHKEWSKAQEAVVRAEMEKSKREWEREAQKTTQVSVEEAVAHTKQHYEGLLNLVRSELTTKHERERAAMTGEIRQLESRVATILKEQQRVSDAGLSSQRLGSFEVDENDENVRPVSRVSLSCVDLQRLRPLVRSAMDNVKQDMLALLHEMQETSRAQHQKELAQVRETTAREVKQYYLQCLHQLVNSDPSNGRASGNFASAPSNGRASGNCTSAPSNGRASGHFGPMAGMMDPPTLVSNLVRVQQPLARDDENLWTTINATRENCPPEDSVCPVSSSALVSSSSREALKDSTSNSQRPRSTEKGKSKKSSARSEKRRSTITPSSSFIQTQFSGPVVRGQARGSSGQMPAVSRCRNQSLKGLPHRHGRAVGVAGVSSVKKDVISGRSGVDKRPRSVVTDRLVHSDGGTRESRSSGRRNAN